MNLNPQVDGPCDRLRRLSSDKTYSLRKIRRHIRAERQLRVRQPKAARTTPEPCVVALSAPRLGTHAVEWRAGGPGDPRSRERRPSFLVPPTPKQRPRALQVDQVPLFEGRSGSAFLRGRDRAAARAPALPPLSLGPLGSGRACQRRADAPHLGEAVGAAFLSIPLRVRNQQPP